MVHTGDSLDIGNGKKLIFVEMTMLHWPDSMATYMTGDNILFSMDAFGQHYAVEEMFNDTADQAILDHEAMKYFANILNPFAPFVTRKLAEPAHRHHRSGSRRHLAGSSGTDCGKVRQMGRCLPGRPDHRGL